MAGAHAGRDKKLFVSHVTPSNNAKKTNMPRQRLSPSSPLVRSIHFGEGLAETEQARQRLGSSCEQARQRLGSSCDLLGAYQYAKYLIHACRGSSTARLTAWKSHHMVAAASSSNSTEACRTALSSQSGLQIMSQYIEGSSGST